MCNTWIHNTHKQALIMYCFRLLQDLPFHTTNITNKHHSEWVAAKWLADKLYALPRNVTAVPNKVAVNVYCASGLCPKILILNHIAHPYADPILVLPFLYLHLKLIQLKNAVKAHTMRQRWLKGFWMFSVSYIAYRSRLQTKTQDPFKSGKSP